MIDYEGIRGHGRYRPGLAMMYFPSIDPADGSLAACSMSVLRIERFQLREAGESDAKWLAETLTRESRRFGASVEHLGGCRLELRW